jgi:hypothetical protein
MNFILMCVRELMNLIILLLVGILLMMAGAVQRGSNVKSDLSRSILEGKETVDADPNVKIVYKYLPADIDTYYRLGPHNKPSEMYAPIFNESEMDFMR